MARILVTGDHGSVAGRDALARIVERLRSDGHDAFVFGSQDEDVERAVRGCDAVIGVLDRIEAGGAALTAYAHAQGKPVLGLTGDVGAAHPVFQEIAEVRDGRDVAAWMEHFPDFYDRIRPFAGRVVRDRIPELVREAGHDVAFRRLDGDEKPRFLKQKVANEAQELARAELAGEKEEVADVLEALEAFILARGFDRDDLRRVKEAKRKRRGAFEQGFVVEATARDEPPAGRGGQTEREAATEGRTDGGREAAAGGDADGERGSASEPDGDTEAEPHRGPLEADPLAGGAPPAAPGSEDDPEGFEYPDEEAAPDVEEPDNLAPERKVGPRFFEL